MTAAAAQPPTRRRWRRVWPWLLGILLALLLLLAGIGWWAGSESSLPRALSVMQRFLPDDQQLVFSDAQGSITGGGHIGRLQWHKPGITVTIDDLQLEWSLRQLFGRDLRVRTLAARNVHVRLTAQPDKPDEPFTMPANVSLPVKVTLPLTVARVQIETIDADGASSTLELDDLAALYRYDRVQHALRLSSLRYDQSHLQAELQLQQRDLRLSAKFAAALRDLTPNAPFAMLSRLHVDGRLAGGDDATLNLQLDATQQAHDAPQPNAAKLLIELAKLPTAVGAEIHAQATIHPWRPQPAQQIELQASGLNAHAFHKRAPVTALRGRASLQPVGDTASATWDVILDFANDLAGPLDSNRAPVDRLQAEVRIGPEQWRADTLELQIGTGRVQLQGEYAPHTQLLDLRGDLQRLQLRRIHSKLATDVASRLSGKLTVAGTLQQGLVFNADLAGDAAGADVSRQRTRWEIRSVQAKGKWSPTRLAIERIHLDAFQAVVDGSDIDVVLPGLDSIKARVTAAAPGVKLAADGVMLRQSGEGKLSVQLTSAETMVAWLQRLPLIGERLQELQAAGAASLEADWRGGWQQWAAGLKNPATQPKLRLNAIAHADDLRIDVPVAPGEPATRFDVQELDLDLQGNLSAATLAISGDVRANDTHAMLDARLRTTQERGTGGAPRWKIAVEKFVASASRPEQTQPWQLQLSENLQITVQTGVNLEMRASAGSASLLAPLGAGVRDEPLKLAWQPLLWQRTSRGATKLQSTGVVTGIQPAWIDVLLARKGEGPLARAGMRTDLQLSGGWEIQMTDSLNIRAHLRRERGDLWLFESGTAAGIRTFDVEVQSTDENVNLALNWDSERAGVITARIGAQLARRTGGWTLPDTAPLSGVIQARLQDLSAWAFLVPPGWRIQGALDANLRLAGTVQTPQLYGDIAGTGLNLRSILDGVDLHDGTLRATVAGARVEIAELIFHGGTGSGAYVRGPSGNRTQPPTQRGRMTASGSIDWSGVANASAAESGIVMDLRAELQKMQVLVRNDRQMTLSGDLSAGLEQGALRVRGDIRVDRASIVLPEASAPTLGDDVVIVRNTSLKNPGAIEARQARGALQTRKPIDMEMKLDLGRDFAVNGQGISTRLEGELTVRSTTNGNGPFSVFGEVRTDAGRYRAWGQALNVEAGVVRFNGSYADPSLNLLAIRPDIEVRAGVRVTGTLNAPRVQLYSDPELPEGEKLSWVVLGRATVSGGAEGTSMQSAALGLAARQFGGKLASGLGLDELGLGASSVSIGKRLSDELYLTYQAGLSGAASTLFIVYDITRRLSVRGATGEVSAVDLVYTISYD